MPDDGKAEPEPHLGSGAAAVGLAEALEDVREELGSDAPSGIADGEADAVVHADDLDVPLPLGDVARPL